MQQHWLRPIVVPAFSIVLGTAGTVLAMTGASRHVSHATEERRELRFLGPLSAVLTAKTAAAHATIASWSSILGHEDPGYMNPTPTRLALGEVDEQLRVHGLRRVQASELAMASASLSSPDAKVRQLAYLAVLDQLSEVLRTTASSRGRQDSPTASAVDAIDAIARLQNQILTVRAAFDIDPLPMSNPELVAYIRGAAAAGDGDPDPTRASLRDILEEPFQRNGAPTNGAELIADRVAIRALARETRLYLAGINTPQNRESVAAINASSHAAIDALNGFASTEVARERIARQKTIDTMTERAQQLRILAVALAVGVIGCAAWMLRRLQHTFVSLRQESELDPLTALRNRTGLRNATEPWFADRRAQYLAVAVMDIDHFKELNDSFGHQAGDIALGVMATRIEREVVRSSTVVSRWGGDEFVVVFLLNQADPTHAVDAVTGVARRIGLSMSTPIELDGTLVAASASIGACVCSCGSCAFDDLFRWADRRLYDVKSAARNDVAVSTCNATATIGATAESRVEAPAAHQTGRA
jgi:diguanylate cyclase (GGDEF)-like protein